MLRSFLESLRPDSTTLLRRISEHITDDMLEEISLGDYGRDPDKHMSALRRVRDVGTFVEPMHWYPCEVLELHRNARPESPRYDPGPATTRYHWTCAFACAALFRAQGEPWKYGADPAQPNFTLIQLIYSLRALPLEFTQDAIQFVAWWMLNSGPDANDVDVVYFGVGLLWLTLQLDTPPPDRDLKGLAEWIVRREEELAKLLPRGFDRWLLGVFPGNPPPSPWEALGEDLSAIDLSGHQTQLREWVKLIGDELSGKNSGLD